MRLLKRIIGKVGGETVDIKKQLGNLPHLIQEHGLLADAVQAMLAADSFVQDDITALREDIDRFSEELQAFAGLAKVSSEMVLTIISRIHDKANTRHQEIKICIKLLETALGKAYRPLSPPTTQRTTSTALLQGSTSGINGDMPLGIASIGGGERGLTANCLFGLIQDLQARVDVLTERSKNTGVIFRQVAFSSEAVT